MPLYHPSQHLPLPPPQWQASIFWREAFTGSSKSKTCKWIIDFLSVRKQHIRLGKHISASRSISSGSPPRLCSFPSALLSVHQQLHLQSPVCHAPEVCGRQHPHWTHLQWGWVRLLRGWSAAICHASRICLLPEPWGEQGRLQLTPLTLVTNCSSYFWCIYATALL